MQADARVDRQEDSGATRMAVMLTIGLFFLWGLANNLNDVLIAHFRHAFALSDFASGLVQSAFYLGYFCFAIPAALTAQRFGYKATVILGLLLFALGSAVAALCHSAPTGILADDQCGRCCMRVWIDADACPQ